MRFGIGMNTDHTLEEVGKQFDVTRERIRQIEAKALRKLQAPEPLAQAAHLPRRTSEAQARRRWPQPRTVGGAVAADLARQHQPVRGAGQRARHGPWRTRRVAAMAARVLGRRRLGVQDAGRRPDGNFPARRRRLPVRRAPARDAGEFRPSSARRLPPRRGRTCRLRLQVALALVRPGAKDGDCFGDAVNLSARLARAHRRRRPSITEQVFEALAPVRRAGYRAACTASPRAGRLIRAGGGVGGAAPGGHRRSPDTHFGELADPPVPTGLTLACDEPRGALRAPGTPLMIGRDPQSDWCTDLPRVSRSHARIDWHAGQPSSSPT
jgi:hypothetical protein